MHTQIKKSDENRIRLLYQMLLENWNKNNANDFANTFCEDGNTIGFDGSQMNGRTQIKDELTEVFLNHKVASYVGIIREVRIISNNVFILRAVAGMVPPGKLKIMPERNAVQSLIATKEQDKFCIALYQNTPAAFDDRPELSKQLTEELQALFDSGQIIR